MKSVISKILFVIGLIVLFLVIAFAIVKFVPMAFSSLANVGSSFATGLKNNTGNALTLEASNTNLTNNETFVLSWTNTLTDEGKYMLSYNCAEDFILQMATNETSRINLICNNPYTLHNGNSVQLTAVLDKEDAFVDVPISVSFFKEGEVTAATKDIVTITVKNTNADSGDVLGDATISSEEPGDIEYIPDTTNTTQTSPTQTTTGTTQDPTAGTTYIPVYTGNADLAISNMQQLTDRSAIQFTVTNLGGTYTGLWNFSYTTPTSPTETLLSPTQYSIGPGQAMRITVQFNEQNISPAYVTVTLDPGNQLYEKNETNNQSTVPIIATTVVDGGPHFLPPYVPPRYDDADLIIRELEVGELRGGRFYEDDTLNDGDDMAIQFTVRNDGDEPTGTWYFEVSDLPLNRDRTYRSDRQRSLNPGDSVEIIVEIENIDEGNYTIEVEVDSRDDVDEENERNNTDDIRLRVRD